MNINDTPVPEQAEPTTQKNAMPPQDPMKSDPLSFEPGPLEFEESADFEPPAVSYPAAQPTENTPAPEVAPADKKEESEQSVYWHQLLTGDADTVPEDVRRAAGAQEAGLTPDERDYRIFSTINRSWYADHRERNRTKVQASWPELRRGLAQELKVADDEREIYMTLSDRYDREKLRTVAKSVYERAYYAAINGEPAPDLRDLTEALPVEYAAAAHVVAVQAEDEAHYKREYYMPLAEELAEGMEVFAALEEDLIALPQVLSSSPALLTAVNRFTKMTQEEQQLVMYLAVQQSRAKRADAEEEGLVSRMTRGWRRGVAQMGMGLWQTFAYAGSATLNNLGEHLGSSGLQSTASDIDKCMQVLRQIRHATQQQVIPLTTQNSSAAETYLMEAVETMPAAVVASFAGAGGFLTLVASGAGDSVVESRLRSPETPQQMQFGAGIISGAVQASIYAGFSRVGGRLMERTINNFMKSCGKGVGKFSWAALKTAGSLSADGAKLMLAGKAAQAADLSLHELAARVSGTASHIDWQQYGDNLLDAEVNMREAASLLPFLLIGAGRAALRHFREPHNLVGDGTRLLEWGIDEKKVNQIVNERNLDRKGELLREALCGSVAWSGPEFILHAIKALRLLNSDYFKGFESPEVVRDFLRLPAEGSVVRRQSPPTRTYEEIKNTPYHAIDRSGYIVMRDSQHLKNALALWDEWWTRSHINEHSSRLLLGEWQMRVGAEAARYERSSRYLAELQRKSSNIPMRMQSPALYAPGAEQERRALLQDRVAELHDLSYQFLMNSTPLEALMSRCPEMSRIRKDAERTREIFLGNIGKALVNAGLGMPREQNFEQLCRWFQSYYLAKKYRQNTRASRNDWLRDVPADYLHNMAEHAPHYKNLEYRQYPELLEAYRIFLGVRANTELLMDLLPMTEDFQTALSRGMSPAQAYELLAERELGYKRETLKNYPAEQVAQTLNITPMEQYTLLNEEKCRTFMQLTGATLQQQQGDDGLTYWRLRRPNGSYSRWHESAAFAMNDVAANAALTFLPLGKKMHEYWAETARANNTNLMQLPLAENSEYSGYDRLCNQATSDLITHWAESVPYVQPGWQRQLLRRRFHVAHVTSEDTAPRYENIGTQELPSYMFDAYSTSTPMSLASTRFYTAWRRLLAAGVLPPQQAADFLNSLGGTWAQAAAALPPPENKADYSIALTDVLTRFSEQYFLMKLEQLPLPPSVKEWVGLAAFCPPVDEASPSTPKKKARFGENAVRWSNRRIAEEVRELMPQVDALRQAYGTQPLPDAHVQLLLDGMLGVDPVQNAEQAWCYRYSGAMGLQTLSPGFMHFLRTPAEWWPRMEPQERRMLYDYLLPFCEQNLPPDAPAGADAVDAAISNLSVALQRYPQLHGMSLAGEKRGRVLTLQLPQGYESSEPLFAEPEYNVPEFPLVKEVKEVGSYTDAALLPELSDPVVQHAMQFLDVLRKYPAQQPYATQNGIRWHNLTYGGKNGSRPAGLELYKPMRPLLRITRMLKEVHELCDAKGADFFNICGVPMPNISPQDLACPALQNITVYRQLLHGYKNRDISDLCRLMPGEASAPDIRERNPYVIDVRSGVYMGENVAIRVLSDPHFNMIPLQRYVSVPHRVFTAEHRSEWGGAVLQHALEGLYALADADASFMEHRISHGLSLTEILMRLYEDTNFSAGVLGKQSVQELAPPALRSLRLAADIIACLAAPYSAVAPESVRAFSRLQKTVRRIRNDEVYRESLEYMLNRGSQMLREFANQPLPPRAPKKEQP